jgi:RNA-binding protein
MPAPTNPKKKSLMPSTPLRRQLRGAGHALTPIVHIGKEGASDPVCRQIHQALDHHELVKVKLGSESPEDRFAVAERLAAEPGVEVAQILGRTLLLYKRNPEIAKFG